MREFSDIYLFNKEETSFNHNGIGILKDFTREPEINRIINGRFALIGEYDINGHLVEYIDKGMIVKALCPDKTYQPFRIDKITRTLDAIEFQAKHYCYDANRNFVESLFVPNGNGTRIINELYSKLVFKQPFIYTSDILTMHQFTAKEGHPIDILIGSNNGNQNLTGVTSGELDMHNNVISLKKRLGEDKGFRIDYGINLEAIEETIEEEELPNSLYLVGAVPEGDYDEKKEPVTLKYLEAPGIKVTDENRVIRKYTNEECTTVQQLKTWADNVLFSKRKVHLPKVIHKISVIDLAGTIEYEKYKELVSLDIGDTVHGFLQSDGKEIEERMIDYTWYPRMAEYSTITLGNDYSFYTSTTQDDFKSTLQELSKTEQDLYNKLINATELINGVQGGSVLQYPKNYPHTTYYMDTDSIDTAKNVIAINNAGIGFSTTGWRGEFKNAWTIDGILNADFIRAGAIEGVDLISKSNRYKTTVTDGRIKFENTSNGRMLGTLFATDVDIDGDQSTGLYVIQENAYPFGVLGKNKNGSVTEHIQVIPEGFGGNEGNKSVIRLKANQVQIKDELHIFGKLFLNGKEITGNGSGGGGGNTGGWNGQYPPEVTTDAEKFAWQAWVTLLSMGYSKAAAAGILGNINGEAGPSMNPDTEQVGGPAYGAVQFDGSRYPLIGSPTNNGREYFQRLHTASGVGGDYREMSPQMKVVDWATRNGQWIGAVNPTTIDGFKSMTSPEQAANAFELNFERPASAHPERQGYARKWYDKFVNLEIPSSDWLTPVRSPYVVTQEWDQIGWGTSVIHGGIDLAPTNGGNPPIYAAKAGTVIVVGNNAALEGNYVMIDHKDGYYTYYGHMVDGSVKVSNGQSVTNQTVIGLMGATGLASGVHLHFEVRKGGQSADFRINPRDVIKF